MTDAHSENAHSEETHSVGAGNARPAEPQLSGLAESRIAAAGGSADKAERLAAREMELTGSRFLLIFGLVMVAASFVLHHSGPVRGLDVLFNTEIARQFGASVPERIYTWLALVGGVLLAIGTLVSRSWIVAWANWAVVGVGWFYSILAIWQTQTRPVQFTGFGPSYGVVIGAVGMTMLFGTLTFALFRRTKMQRELARLRVEAASRDESNRLRQQRLRTGLEAPQKNAQIVDDRRARAKARRKAKDS